MICLQMTTAHVDARSEAIARRRLIGGVLLAASGIGGRSLVDSSLCSRVSWLPGHAYFHISMAVGLTNCLLYFVCLEARDGYAAAATQLC